MKPIIQAPLDALDARIRALESSMASSIRRIALLEVPTRGRWLGRQVFTTNLEYVPSAGTRRVLVRMIGGGGAGGGTTGTTGIAAGGGGHSGWYLEFFISSLVSAGAVVCGQGGFGLDGGGGLSGQQSSIVLNGTSYIAMGGSPGSVGPLSTGGVSGPSAAIAGSTDVSAIGFASYGAGEVGVWVSAVGGSFAVSGRGGYSPFGTVGLSVATSGPGTTDGGDGTFGGGGGGSVGNSAGGAQTSTGGDGGRGMVVIDEFS